jgi:hypothetical protein
MVGIIAYISAIQCNGLGYTRGIEIPVDYVQYCS